MAEKPGKNLQIYTVVLLLLVVTAIAYLPVFRADFVGYDDKEYVAANPHVQSGLTPEGFKWAFNVGYQSNWHPLTWISHMADVSLFGTGPVGPHAVNLTLHLLNTLLLFLVLNRMTKSQWKSAFVAALFALHPMHVESVAWVAERKDVLSTLFWMLTLWAYARYSESPNIKRYSLVLLFFALGLMSKPTLVSLPIVLLLLDYWPLGRWNLGWGKLISEKLPLFALSAASCIITYIAQQTGGAVRTFTELPLAARLANVPNAYASYIGKMLWPVKLAAFYPHAGDIPVWLVAVSLILLAGITVLAIRSARNRPYLLVGWLWYLVVLVPMIGLVQVGGQAMADRYTYVSLIGLFVMLAWGVSESVGVWEHGGAGTKKRKRKKDNDGINGPLTVLAIGVALALAGCTMRQASYWQNSLSLWSHTIAVTKNNDTAHNGLGLAYVHLGMYEQAVEEYKQAVSINPKYADAYYNLGCAYGSMGRFPSAVDALKKAIEINPDHAKAHQNLGNAYGELRDFDSAIEAYKQAIRIEPDYALARLNLGLTYAEQGLSSDAMKEYRALVKLDPAMANQLLAAINM